jgi:pyruvate formate lyase activating enzyme
MVSMKIGHVLRTSFIDYPGRISAVLFTRGCNFRCPYCHNPELVDPSRFGEDVSLQDICGFLEKRRGKLDAVVITGGEPTLQSDLLNFMQRVKSLGFLVKLDTNGTRPEIIQEAFRRNLLDFISMDVKAPWDKYSLVAGCLVNITPIRKSIETIIASKTAHEFRTTHVRSLLDPGDVVGIAEMIRGAQRYVLQKFVPSKHLDTAYIDREPLSDEEIAGVLPAIRGMVDRCITR